MKVSQQLEWWERGKGGEELNTSREGIKWREKGSDIDRVGLIGLSNIGTADILSPFLDPNIFTSVFCF